MNNSELIIKLKNAREKEKNATYVVLKYLCEVEKRKAYCPLGYGSLYKFLVKELGYSEGESSTRIAAVRVMMKSPVVEKSIKEGRLGLTNASEFKKSLDRTSLKVTESSICAMVDLISDKSTRETQQILQDTLKLEPKKSKMVELNERLLLKLDRVRRKLGDFSDLELIEILLDEKLNHVEQKNESKVRYKNSRYIPVKVKAAALKRSGHRCEYVGAGGARCQERVHLEFDHIQAFSRGGSNGGDNIQVLCRGHNSYKGPEVFC